MKYIATITDSGYLAKTIRFEARNKEEADKILIEYFKERYTLGYFNLHVTFTLDEIKEEKKKQNLFKKLFRKG